jgi:hypothetical protein
MIFFIYISRSTNKLAIHPGYAKELAGVAYVNVLKLNIVEMVCIFREMTTIEMLNIKYVSLLLQ